MLKFLNLIYHEIIGERTDQINFWILASFLPTFIVARMLVYLDPGIFLRVGNTHIHHLTYGIFILAIAGYFAQLTQNPKLRIPLALLYGVGLALSFDEFGMWLRLEDDYWIRTSYDSVIIITAALINIVYFPNFWFKLLRIKYRI